MCSMPGVSLKQKYHGIMGKLKKVEWFWKTIDTQYHRPVRHNTRFPSCVGGGAIYMWKLLNRCANTSFFVLWLQGTGLLWTFLPRDKASSSSITQRNKSIRHVFKKRKEKRMLGKLQNS